MRVHIVYAHPSDGSFTHALLDAFQRGLTEAGHQSTVSDLYRMGFQPSLTPAEYLRESSHGVDWPVPDDVAAEQAELDAAQVWTFVYPVWWTDCPAILKGWFDRVWTIGQAYHPTTLNQADQALVLCAAGHTADHLRATGCYQAMETTMLTDRIAERAKAKRFVLFDGSEALADDAWRRRRAEHLDAAHRLGRELAM
ncbi:MAG: NAD(P)H-dependent oxidoreductase [Propionibacteriaceae bacterium]|nr:NAD(P)H-dependent oxidoreductase [Propionibacteriaceae bacterium]